MPQARKPRTPKDQVAAARAKELERALKEERIGLLGITMAILRMSVDPQAVSDRLDALVRAAQANPRTRPGTMSALIEGQKLMRRALAIELEKPQPLFEPDIGPTKPEAVIDLVDHPEEQQMGLALGTNGASDAEAAAQDRAATIARVQEAVIAMFVEHGSLTDAELYGHYIMRTDFVKQSPGSLRTRRVELVRKGRIVDSHEVRDGDKVWDLVERR
jgi:hypothetical protein